MNQFYISVILIVILLVGCDKPKEAVKVSNIDPIIIIDEIPEVNRDHADLSYDNMTSLWSLNDNLYSGYSVEYYGDGSLKEKFGVYNGRKSGQAIKWYPDGTYKQVANYHQGKLHGDKSSWSADSNHILVSKLNYYKGKMHGEQKLWYTTGEPYKDLNLVMGREEGIQKAYRKNGVVYANYEAKEGRIFGLKKAALCYELEDENINYGK